MATAREPRRMLLRAFGGDDEGKIHSLKDEFSMEEVQRRWLAGRPDGRRFFYVRTGMHAALTVEPSENTRSFMGYQGFLWGGYMGYTATASLVQKLWQRGWISHSWAMFAGVPFVTVGTLVAAGTGDALSGPCVRVGLRMTAALLWGFRGFARDSGLSFSKRGNLR